MAFANVPNIVYNGTATGSPWFAKSMNGYVDGYLVYEDATKTNLLACSTAASGEIVIPNSVTNIYPHTFNNCIGLTSVIIPNSVTSINNWAFASCTGITSVTIPESVTNIGEDAFWSVPNIQYKGTATGSPWGATSMNGYVDGYLVYKDTTKTELLTCGTAAIGKIIIPRSVTSIRGNIFNGCTGLTSIVVEDGNTIYDSRENCNAIIETKSNTLIASCQTTTIPKSVTSIGGGAFGRTNLKEVVLLGEIREIGDATFSYSDSLVSVVMGDNVKIIGDYAFIDCHKLSNVVFGNSIDTIGYSAFHRCNVKTVTLPDSLKYIDVGAFCRCYNLSSISIPRNVNYIGGQAFLGCDNLKSIVVDSENTVFDSRNNCNAIIETATYTLIVGCQTTTIPDGVMHIGDLAFSSNNCKDSIVLPESVVSIEYGAFGSCTNLTFISISKNMTDIGSNAFSGCSNLQKIVLETTNPPVLEKWGETDRVFEDCPVDTIYIPCGTKAAYTSIHWGGFDDDKFVEMECPPFGRCGDNLYWSYADDTLSITGTGDMYDYAADSAHAAPWVLFRDSITTITFPEGITYIGTHAFRQLPLLTVVTIPNAVEEIGESAFAGCTALGKVVIGSGNSSRLATLGDSVFIDSRKLYEIHIAATEPPVADRTTFLNYNVHLYVPCESKDKYDLDLVFGDFKYIECLDTDTPVDEFSVTPAQTSAQFVWGAPSNASTYTLDLQQEDAQFFTLVFNATGQLHSISLAPIGSQVRLTAAEKAGNGFTFNATGLTTRTLYNYDLTIRDAAEVTLQNYSGYFYTTSDIPTGTEDSAADDTTPRKVFRDGQVYILRGGKTYTVMGQETSDLSNLSRGEAQ